jgi:hypothetical protein
MATGNRCEAAAKGGLAFLDGDTGDPDSTASLGADDVAKQFTFAVFELHHLELLDGGEVGG